MCGVGVVVVASQTVRDQSEPLLALLPATPEVHSDQQKKGAGKLLIQAAETQAGKGQRGF